MFLLPHFMQDSVKQYQLYRIEGGSNGGTDYEESSYGALRSNYEVSNYLLQRYSNDGIVYATDDANNSLRRRKNQSAIEVKDVIFA